MPDDRWNNFLAESSEIPDDAAAIIATMTPQQIQLLEGYSSHLIDVIYDAFAMHFDTDAASFVRMLPEDERLSMVDVSDDLESAFRDALRKLRP